MLELQTNTALADVATPIGLAVGLREMTGRGMIDLRGLATDKTFMAAAKEVLGVALPTEPRTSASWGDIKVLWLSIDQWLLLCAEDKAGELLAGLRQGLAGIHSLAVDVSHMRSVIRLEGEGAREVLMK